MQIGIDSFAALVSDPITGNTVTAQQRIAHLLEEIELADRVGLDVFGLGEHHRVEYLADVAVFGMNPDTQAEAGPVPQSLRRALGKRPDLRTACYVRERIVRRAQAVKRVREGLPNLAADLGKPVG